MHYHLSGTNFENMPPGCMNKLLHEAACIGKSFGLKRLHFGGGRTAADPKDTLFEFKRSMGTHTHPFYIGKRIHNPYTYKELCEKWQKSYPEHAQNSGNRLLRYRLEPIAAVPKRTSQVKRVQRKQPRNRR